MLSLAIVYPVFNGLQFTQNSLYSLFSLQHIDKQNAKIYVVIVDDGSTDGTYQWIKENYPQVILLKGNGNLWWSGGINMAVKYSIDRLKCDYIIWWNNDILASENYFSTLISHLKSSDINTIIGSKIYHAHQKNTIWSMGGLFDPKSGRKSLIGSAEIDSPLYEQITGCDWLPGMGTITHKSIYERIGMLDEKNFPQYHGDSDFTFRAKKIGYKIIVNPFLKIYNDTLHSGIRHDNSFKRLIQSLFSIKSNYNIRKDYLFYKRHAESINAYSILIIKYSKYIGGFIKWNLLSLIGITRNVKK
jgi:GT2 family glycosyltransferase